MLLQNQPVSGYMLLQIGTTVSHPPNAARSVAEHSECSYGLSYGVIEHSECSDPLPTRNRECSDALTNAMKRSLSAENRGALVRFPTINPKKSVISLELTLV